MKWNRGTRQNPVGTQPCGQGIAGGTTVTDGGMAACGLGLRFRMSQQRKRVNGRIGKSKKGTTAKYYGE